MNNLSVISLFSGCGGMDLGFQQAGFNVEWANEIDPDACSTYRHNIGDHVFEGDIRELQRHHLPENIDVVIGGFPCQGFSMAGKRVVNDDRNFLYKEMKRIVEIVQPKIFVAENVRGLLSMEKGAVIQKIVDDFTELGYRVEYRLLFAPQYTVPQSRYRVFIIGTRIGEDVLFPEPTNDILTYKTVRKALGDIVELGDLPNHELRQTWPKYYDFVMERVGEGQKLCNSRHGASSIYTWDIPEAYGETTPEERELLVALAKNRRHKKYGEKDGNPLSDTVLSQLINQDLPYIHRLTSSLIEKGYLIEKRHRLYDITKANFNRFIRLNWDAPAPTVLTNFDSPRNYLHPSENRPLTVREAARLQSFPDDFIFKGNYKKQYTQVGNAVPPLLAYHVATAVKCMLERGGNQNAIH